MEVSIYPVKESYGGDFMKFCVREGRTNLPKWYKESKSFVGDPRTPLEKDKSMTMKKCTPILDYLTTGLTLHLPFAIYANGTYPNRKITATLEEPECKLGNHHPDQIQLLPVPKDYDPYPLKVDFPFVILPPNGYSILFTPSSPYSEWPLFFPPAIVQSDKYKTSINFPFLVKKDFEGKIDAGTEFMKVIFIKRESLKVNYKTHDDAAGMIQHYSSLVQAFGSGFYKKIRLNNIIQ